MENREIIRRLLRQSALLPAPMCNYSDRPFRDLMRMMGARLVYTEMYSSEAMVRGDPKTFRLMDFRDEQGPVAVQIFGSRPALMAECARMVERLGATILDLNMGCPAKKIVGPGSGAGLAENPKNAVAVVRALVEAVGIPVTVKMRWQPGGESLDLARRLEDLGVEALGLHARTREQGYSGEARWEWIKRMKESLSIPVIGNGDVVSAEGARLMQVQTGCDAVMAGRSLVGNPWLMAEVVQQAHLPLDQPRERLEPNRVERLRVLMAHGQLMHQHRGPKGLIEFRKHCAGYIKGLPGARQARVELMQVTELEELRQKLVQWFGEFEEEPPPEPVPLSW